MPTPQKGETTGLLRIVIGQRPLATLRRAVILGVVCFFVFKFVLRPSWTRGISMEPTVADRSLHFVNLLAYTGDHAPARGDIVAIKTGHARAMFLKRILALPGETVAFVNDQLVVNGEVREEPYVVHRNHEAWDMNVLALGRSEYFVAGDNRGSNREQHLHGPVHKENILGTLLW